METKLSQNFEPWNAIIQDFIELPQNVVFWQELTNGGSARDDKGTVREVKLKAGTGEEKTQVVKDDERGEVSSFDKLSDTEAFLPHD